MPQLPETVMPELRAKWLKLNGAREVVQHALAAAQAIEAEYTTTLNMVLRMLELDPAQNWRVNLETGEIAVAPEAPPESANGLQTPVPLGAG